MFALEYALWNPWNSTAPLGLLQSNAALYFSTNSCTFHHIVPPLLSFGILAWHQCEELYLAIEYVNAFEIKFSKSLLIRVLSYTIFIILTVDTGYIYIYNIYAPLYILARIFKHFLCNFKLVLTFKWFYNIFRCLLSFQHSFAMWYFSWIQYEKFFIRV